MQSRVSVHGEEGASESLRGYHLGYNDRKDIILEMKNFSRRRKITAIQELFMLKDHKRID